MKVDWKVATYGWGRLAEQPAEVPMDIRAEQLFWHQGEGFGSWEL